MAYSDAAAMQIVLKTIASEYDLLLGRRTYEIWALPHHGHHPIGKAFNKATKHVVTSALCKLNWENSRRIDDDVVGEIRRLKASDGPPFHIWGSSQLFQTLIASDLIDEYRLWIFPVILGKGKRLFENTVPPRALTLVQTQTTSNGVLLNTYRPAGPVKTVEDVTP